MDKRPRSKNPFRRRKKRAKKKPEGIQLSKSTKDLLKFHKGVSPEVNAIILDTLANLLEAKAIVSDAKTIKEE